jgi:hypothetical protein
MGCATTVGLCQGIGNWKGEQTCHVCCQKVDCHKAGGSLSASLIRLLAYASVSKTYHEELGSINPQNGLERCLKRRKRIC